MRSLPRWSRAALAAFGALGAVAFPGTGTAAYPEKPITFLVPFTAGGATDLTARAIGKVAAKDLGQPMVIVNKPGAGGAAALAELAKAAPDGYTLATFNAIVAAIGPHMREMPFDAKKDFTPIMNYGAYTTFIAVRAAAPWKSLKDLVEYAKANPKVLTAGISAIGASSHLGMARLMAENKAEATFVPFGGGAPAVAALLGGHLGTAVVSGEILPHVRSGEVRLLTLLQDAKVKEFPDLKNIRELGYDWDLNSWLGIAGPPGMNPAVVKTLEQAFTKAMQDPEFKDVMEKLAMLTIYHDSATAKTVLDKSYDEFGAIVKTLGIGLYTKK
ncbi:MAG: tripartite tricarboxylate transporter substrate binding protein [Proteobacteria bacterium]|nr:tripartite tricarboxylate transporter substrate binding protein [Pseudomonadota bacterium]